MAACVLTLSAPPATGITTPGTGSPGNVSFAPYVNAQHFYPHMPSIVFGGTDVYRSPAYAGDQVVTVTYGVWTRTGNGWSLNRWNIRSMTLRPGQYGPFGAIKFDPLYQLVGYRAVITVEWRPPPGGRRVLSRM